MFLSIVHLRERRCGICNDLLAAPGARSFVVAADGSPEPFDRDDPLAEMTVEIRCANGHATQLFLPNEISAEETLLTPDDAPLGRDATLRSGKTESGRPL